MTKISLISISFTVFLFASFSANAQTQSSEDLFKKVFGKTEESKRITIDATLGDFYLGGVSAFVSGDKIISLSGSDLEKLLLSKVRKKKRVQYQFGSKDITTDSLPFKVIYLPAELRLKFEIPPADLDPISANVYDDLIPYYAKKASPSAPFSFGTNYKLEDVEVRKLDQQNYFTAQVDSFANLKEITLDNQMSYLSTKKMPWYRQNSKAVYDRADKMQRFELGDISYPIIGLQSMRSIGGLSFYRDFSLDPYRQTNPSSSLEYEIESRSLVRTYVNGLLLKTEYMNIGHYSVKDIPLNNGLNKIIIDITDDFGKKRVLVFNEPGSSDLLNVGLSKYSLAAGLQSTDTDTFKKYDKVDGTFYTTFYQYGFNKFWTPGIYSQGNSKYNLLGINNLLTSSFGNWSFDFATTKNKNQSGQTVQSSYQLNLFGTHWYDSHTLNARVSYKSPWFNDYGETIENKFDFNTSIAYAIPFFERFNVAVGGNYENPRKGNLSRYGFNTSITSRLFSFSSLTFYYARNRDESKLWNTQLYLFFNMSFGESSTYASAFYDHSSETKRVTLIKDDGKKVNSLKVAGSVEDATVASNGALDLQYNTPLADFGIREEVIKNKGHKALGSKTSLRFLSAFAYVYNGSDSAISISRPIANSFVIFKPIDSWKGQHFGAQTTGGSNDSEVGLFGESLISGLTPYQYKQLQLDPGRLDPGYILGQESFVVYPRYRSGHLFVVGKEGLLVLKGILLDNNKKPQPLKVGYWTSDIGKTTAFFTNREGEFFIEGIEATSGKIQLDDEQFEAKELNLEKRKSGVVDIGIIELPYKESHL